MWCGTIGCVMREGPVQVRSGGPAGALSGRLRGAWPGYRHHFLTGSAPPKGRAKNGLRTAAAGGGGGGGGRGSFGVLGCLGTPPPPSASPRRGHECCARTTGLRLEVVYGGDIQSIDTDR